MFLYAVIILLAGGLVWSELNRRQTKETLLGMVKDSNDESIEIKREIDLSTQSPNDVISEVYDLEKEMLSISEKKKEYKKGIAAGGIVNANTSITTTSKSINVELNLENYVDAF